MGLWVNLTRAAAEIYKGAGQKTYERALINMRAFTERKRGKEKEQLRPECKNSFLFHGALISVHRLNRTCLPSVRRLQSAAFHLLYPSVGLLCLPGLPQFSVLCFPFLGPSPPFIPSVRRQHQALGEHDRRTVCRLRREDQPVRRAASWYDKRNGTDARVQETGHRDVSRRPPPFRCGLPHARLQVQRRPKASHVVPHRKAEARSARSTTASTQPRCQRRVNGWLRTTAFLSRTRTSAQQRPWCA